MRFRPVAARAFAWLLSLASTLALTSSTVSAAPAAAATRQHTPAASHPRSGDTLYREGGCITCHGTDGRGVAAPAAAHVKVPDFTRCALTTSTPDDDWLAVIHEGGEARALGHDMPAFRDRLSDEEMEGLVAYLRAFCTNTAWPRGNLNLPRALFTEQAYPENAALLTTTIDHGADAAVGNSLLYEHRLGTRQQFEVRFPFNVRKFDGTWQHGVGDLTLAFKQVINHDVGKGRIISGGTELILPTGQQEHGLGTGATQVEPFLVYAQVLSTHTFVQVHTAYALSSDTVRAPREFMLRAAAGHRLPHGWGRIWTPMVELLASRELGARPEEHGLRAAHGTAWDAVPELQLTLSRRQHVTLNGGLKIPLTQREERTSEVAFYVLWDWLHGGLFDGWR